MSHSVERAGRVLRLFTVERPEWGPSAVAAELGISKGGAHALLRSLATTGLLEPVGRGRYRVGWQAVALARTALATSGERAAFTRVARRLVAATGETVHLAARDGDDVVYVASVRPPGGVRAVAQRLDGGLTPLGRALAGEPTVGDQPALPGVRCAAAPAGDRLAVALCAPASRFRDDHALAVAGASRRIRRAVRER